MDKLKDRLTALRRETEVATERAEKAEAKVKELQQQINTLESENRTLESSKKHHEEQHDKVRGDLAEVTKKHLEENSTRQDSDFKIQSLQRQIEQKDETIGKLEEEVKKLKVQIDEWEKSLSDI